MTDAIKIYTDGGSRGNPGQAALGVVIYGRDKIVLWEKGKAIGKATNNVAEYLAVVEAFTWLNLHSEIVGQYSGINFYLDSKLVCCQMAGLFKIKNQNLYQIFLTAKALERKIILPITYTHIPREQNKKADSLVNQALDANAW